MGEKLSRNFQRHGHLVWIILITVHSFLMNGYYYAHRQLTVGTYLSSIFAHEDPSLFKNSIYVQAVQRCHLRISIFYDISPFIIKHFDFETFALLQAVVSLFFVLAGIFALSKTLFNSPSAGYMATLLYTAALDKWIIGSPAPYLNFFHHGLPYTYPLVIWSMVFFFRQRCVISLLLAGLSWNFHPMTTAFLLFIYCFYIIIRWQQFNTAIILKGAVIFIISASPALIESLQYLRYRYELGHLWLTGVRWTLWFTNFPFAYMNLVVLRSALFFLLFVSTLFALPLASRKKVIIVTAAVVVMCLTGTIYAHMYPILFIIKLSLWRSTFFYGIFAIVALGYILSILLEKDLTQQFLAINTAVIITGYLEAFKLYYLPLFTIFLLFSLYEPHIKGNGKALKKMFPLLFFSCLTILVVYQIYTNKGSLSLILLLLLTLFFLIVFYAIEHYWHNARDLHYHIAAFVIFIFLLDFCVLYQKGGPEIYYHGRIKGEADPWAEIQLYANAHSEKDDLFIVPPYLNDFTTYSLRAVVGDWAEGCTLIYLDRQFVEQWFERMNDLNCKPYQWFVGYNNLSTDQIVNVARKYNAAYVVTEKPKTFELKKIYENKKFILYRID